MGVVWGLKRKTLFLTTDSKCTYGCWNVRYPPPNVVCYFFVERLWLMAIFSIGTSRLFPPWPVRQTVSFSGLRVDLRKIPRSFCD